MSQYIIVGGQTLLGVDADGNYRLLTAPMGNAERLAEMGPEGLKGGAPRVVSSEMDKGFKYVDVQNMEPAERGKLLNLAESLTLNKDGSGGQMAFVTKSEHSDKITKFVDVIKKLKASIGGKLPGVLGILDILGMKKEYDQILAGEHPILNQVIDTENKPLTYKDGGYVTSPFVKDIFSE